MKQPSIFIDFDNSKVVVGKDDKQSFPLNSPQAFAVLSDAWIRCGWDTKYVYSFSWLGRPIIQLPDDMMRIQEVIFRIKPDLIIETGVAHGGSLIFYASLCHAMGRGAVLGIDIEIRKQNREAIEAHPLSRYVTLLEGDSVSPDIVAKAEEIARDAKSVLVLLDSCHTKEHVLKELRLYSPLVSVDSFIVATDGIMGKITGAPRTQADWEWNNPEQAALEFVTVNPDFVIEEPVPPFNEGQIVERVTYWPKGFLKRVR
jgi:cephalosporin hydroxylase